MSIIEALYGPAVSALQIVTFILIVFMAVAFVGAIVLPAVVWVGHFCWDRSVGPCEGCRKEELNRQMEERQRIIDAERLIEASERSVSPAHWPYPSRR